MTSDRPPLDDLDLSAVLDGDASDDVLARLAGEPGARDRLERLRAAQAALAGASVEPLPERTVDSLVATALTAGDLPAEASTESHEGSDGGSTDDAIVAPLPSRRRKPPPPWAVAAVVIALVAIGLTLVWGGLDDDGDEDLALRTADSSMTYEDAEGAGERESDDPAPEAETSAPSSEADDAAAGSSHFDGEVTTTVPGPGVDASEPQVVALGEFADADALRVHLRDAFPTDPIDSARGDDVLTAAARCVGKLDGLFGASGDPTIVGSATVAGEAVVAYELPFRTDDGRDTTLVMAVGEATCIPVLSFQR